MIHHDAPLGQGVGRLGRLQCAVLARAGHAAGKGNVMMAVVLVAIYVLAV